MTRVEARLALPAEVCATLAALGKSGDRADAVPLKTCGEALGRLGEQIRALVNDHDTSAASSREEARRLIATLAGVDAAARIVELETATE